MARYTDVFEELWQEECGVCYEGSVTEHYFINKCRCQNLVCEVCAHRCARTSEQGQWVYSCPFCRMETPAVTIYYWRHSPQKKRADRARANWRYWFARFDCLYFIQPYLRLWSIPLFNNDPLHIILRTGDFSDPQGAGVCYDREAARLYVQDQMDRFMANPHEHRPGLYRPG